MHDEEKGHEQLEDLLQVRVLDVDVGACPEPADAQRAVHAAERGEADRGREHEQVGGEDGRHVHGEPTRQIVVSDECRLRDQGTVKDRHTETEGKKKKERHKKKK